MFLRRFEKRGRRYDSTVERLALSEHPRDQLDRSLGLFDATMLVVASVVGAGIFFAPGQVASLLPDPHWILVAWCVGGALSLAGALANAELGALFPRAGGDYVYLREAFHPVVGFLVGWLTFFAIYTGTIAALALAFAEGAVAFLGWSEASVMALAVSTTLGISFVNALGVKWGARGNNLTSIIKLMALVAFVVFGLSSEAGDWSRVVNDGDRGLSHGAGGWVDWGRALSPILFSYLGWNASVFVASEIRSPARNVPRSLFLGLGLCVLIYLAVNTVYLYALPLETLAGTADVGESAGRALFGPVGGRWVGVFVLISVLGALNATVLVGPRIAYAMALDDLFFKGVERAHSRYRTPAVAIGVQAVSAVVLLGLLRSFPRALDFTVFAILLATSADVVALYWLRRSQPQRPRPYRAWGYPWLPGLYLLANAGVATTMFIGSPLECGISLALLLVGLPFYAFFRRREGRAASQADVE
ncbi:MAG: amino acid permease [Deltaproteobacteria bacterium]|nr:amino acid permease [Deltaproteobacteria bacterium]